MRTSPAPATTLATSPCPAAAAAPLNAALWVQTSAEHDAVLRGIYATARQQLATAIESPSWTALDSENTAGKPPAIILDLDETAIDTSASTARLLKKSATYSEPEWSTFALAGNSRALAPALEFLQEANRRGVAIFYITNRIAAHEAALHRNLVALGFPLGDPQGDSILTRGERPEWASGDKSPRRAFVAERYRVLMLFGDDLNDFAPAAGKSIPERNEIVRSHGAWWGSRWFALPNPMYGSWERAVTGDAKGDCAQWQRKLDALRTDETYLPSPVLNSQPVVARHSEMSRALDAGLASLPAFKSLVAGAHLCPEAREAAAPVRAIIEADQVPQSATESLPAGFARLDRLELSGDSARITLWYGPVPKALKGQVLLNCGTGYTLELQRGSDGAWTVSSRGVSVC
ncbi:MAG: HAD family acid phosphatase [Thermoanaerobaculia bacterium]